MKKNALLIKRIVRILGIIILIGLAIRIIVPWIKLEPVILTKSEGVVALVALLFALATNKAIELLITLVQKLSSKITSKNNGLQN